MANRTFATSTVANVRLDFAGRSIPPSMRLSASAADTRPLDPSLDAAVSESGDDHAARTETPPAADRPDYRPPASSHSRIDV